MLRLSPASGTTVARRFVARARPAGRHHPTAVTFRLDGKTVCVDHRAPFACAMRSHRGGWHRVSATVRGHAKASVAARVRVRH